MKNETPMTTEAEVLGNPPDPPEPSDSEITSAREPTSEPESNSLSSNPWFDLLSRRSRNCLDRAGITTLEALQATSPEDLLAIRAFGQKCLSEVERFLEANGVARTAEVSAPASEESFFVEKTVGFGDLQENTRSMLQQLGISTAKELEIWSLREILEATEYEEGMTNDLGVLARLTGAQDEDTLLALLFASNLARASLAQVSNTEEHDFFDRMMELQERVRSQIERGTLDERAAIDWAPLQSLNGTFRPPANTLPSLLERLQSFPGPKSVEAIRELALAVSIPSLQEELDLLYERLDERGTEVVRLRLAVGQRGTLAELGTRFGVSRERIRQIEKEAGFQLRQAYYWELPLLRLRTTMLLIREHRLFAIPDMVRHLRERGLATSEATVRDLLVFWRALDLADSGVSESLAQWKVIDPNVYAFPEEILSVAATGLTPRQQALSKEVIRVARRTASRVGVTTTGQIAEALNQEDPPVVEDIASILLNSGFQEVLPNHWTTVGQEYSILREVVGKMLSICGPLNLRQLRRGLLRHQKRLGFYVPPVAVLGPVLAHQDVFEVDEDGVCSLKDPGSHSLRLGLAEQVWVETAKAHGPVVHVHSILRAFKEKGINRINAYQMMRISAIVEKVGKQLFVLPGANITEVDLEAGREQAIWGRSGQDLAAPQTVRPMGEPALIDPEPSADGAQEESEPLAGEPVRARLQYEATENKLSMALPETIWQGDVSVHLSWDDQELDLPTNYLPAEDLTKSGAAALTLNEPFWEKDGLLFADRSRREVRFTRPPMEHGLVFRAPDGKALGRWRTGEEHYIVVPTERMSEEKVAEIFEEWHSLGQPEGWEDFTALWVRTKNPLEQSGAQRGREGASAVIDSFSRATRELGLPDFDSLWLPRLRLVGGGSLGKFEGRERFTIDRPPYLEVNGLWDSTLEVSLSRWITGSVEFVQEETLQIPSQAEATCQVEIWSKVERPREGRYRVEIGNQQVEFEIVKSVPDSLFARPTVGLQLQRDGENLGESDLRRRDLERGTLVGRAWPGARLTFTVASGTWSHSLAVTTDEEGDWSVRWQDLGLPEIPNRLLKLELSWRGLIGSKLIISDGPFIQEDNVDLSFRVRESEKSLVLSGTVSKVGEYQQARAVLLGERPWAGEIWTQKMSLDELGAFEARFYDVHEEVRWLLILPGERSFEDDARDPWLIQAQSEDAPHARYPLGKLQGERPDVWEELVDELKSAPLPPALSRLLELSDLGDVLDSVAETYEGSSQWIPAEKLQELHQLLSWQRFGLRAPVAVFSPETPVSGKPPSEELPPLLTVGLKTLTESMDQGTDELSLECVTGEGHRRRIKGSVSLNGADSENGFELHPEELLYACPRCGLILPPAEFWNHPPPGRDMPSCTAERHSLHTVREGRNKPVTLLMSVDARRIGYAVKELVRRVVTGDEEDVPVHAEPWLDSLQEAYFEEGGDREPEVWLDALYSAHTKLRSMRKHGEPEARLADLGRSVRQHRIGLDVLAQWLNNEAR